MKGFEKSIKNLRIMLVEVGKQLPKLIKPIKTK